MLKKCILFTMFFSVLNLQAMYALRYIPAKSEVREYCKNNQDNSDCQIIANCLQKVSNTKFDIYTDEIGCIDFKLKELDDEASSLQSETIPNFNQYVSNKKARLQGKKALLLKECLPVNFLEDEASNDKTQYNGAFENILKNIDAHKHDQERQYLKEGFSNAYEHKKPWNTYTIKDKAESMCGVALLGFYVISLCLYAHAVSQPNSMSFFNR